MQRDLEATIDVRAQLHVVALGPQERTTHVCAEFPGREDNLENL